MKKHREMIKERKETLRTSGDVTNNTERITEFHRKRGEKGGK